MDWIKEQGTIEEKIIFENSLSSQDESWKQMFTSHKLLSLPYPEFDGGENREMKGKCCPYFKNSVNLFTVQNTFLEDRWNRNISCVSLHRNRTPSHYFKLTNNTNSFFKSWKKEWLNKSESPTLQENTSNAVVILL